MVNAAIDETPKPWHRDRAMAETPESDVVRITPYPQRTAMRSHKPTSRSFSLTLR